MTTERIDVLAVMDRLVKYRSQWLPEGAADLAGPIRPELFNPIVASAIERYNEAVEVRAVVAALIKAAHNASAVLSHAYHTQISGPLADDAHDAYQALDTELGRAMGCNCPGEGRFAPSSHAPNCPARAALARVGGA